MKSITKSSIANLVCAMIDPLFSMAATSYIARVLLADGAGKVAFAQSIVIYFSALAEFGISGYGIREIAKVKLGEKDIDIIFTELMTVNFITTTCSLMCYFGMLLFCSEFRSEKILFLVCSLAIFLNYFNVDWVFQGEEEYVYIAGRNLIVKIVSLIFIFVFVHTKDDYIKYALIVCITNGLNIMLNMCMLHKFVRFTFCSISLKRHLKPLSIFTVNNVLTSLYDKVDITLIGMLSTEMATGYYSYAYSLIRMIMRICASIPAVLYPRLSYCYKNDQREFERLLYLGIRITIFIVFPASMGIFILVPQIVTIILGNDFWPAVRTFRILSILIVIQGIADLCFQLIMATGHEEERARALWVALLGNILLNFIFIPFWDDCGAAIACIISELGLNSYLVWKIHRKIRFQIPWRAFGQALISTVIMGIAIFIVSHFNFEPIVQCVIAIVSGIAVYGILNLLMRNELLYLLIKKMRAALYRLQ